MSDLNSIKVTFQKDVLGLSKPATKLVEIIGQAGNTVGNAIFKYDAKKIVRISEAEAKAAENKLVTSKNKTEILRQQITQRLLIQQYRKQVNLNNIAARANELLSSADVSETTVDTDWATRFVNVAEDTFDSHIQEILANILAGEAMSPGASSKRLLDFLNSTDKYELELFSKFAGISSDVGLYHMNKFNSASLSQYNLSVPEIIMLSNIGLVNLNRELSVHLDFENGKEVVNLNRFKVILKKNPPAHVELGIVPLTKLGEELYKFTRPYAFNSKLAVYLQDLQKSLKNQQLEVSIIKRDD